jgi:LCP family protein required for cell wall assembly
MGQMQRTSTWGVVGVAILLLAAIIGFLLISNQQVAQVVPSPTASPSPSPTPSPSPSPPPTPSPTPEPTPSPTPVAAATPTPAPSFSAEVLNRQWTVLFVGVDSDWQRQGTGLGHNTDALMLASLSSDQSTLTLVSLPRDTVDVPLATGGSYGGKINGLYATLGLDALKGAMATMYGVAIDAHVVMDMDDVSAIVNAVGGVSVNNPYPLADPLYTGLHLPAGPHLLDGPTALLYVRTRLDQDYGRMRRQQEVIVDLVGQLTGPGGNGVDVGALVGALDSLNTDLPLNELPTLLELGRRAYGAEVQYFVIQPPYITFQGDLGDGRGYVLVADFAAIRAQVQALIAN